MHQIGAHKVWKSIAAGLCGNAAHSAVMFLKRWMGWLPTFHPYRDLQHGLSDWLGGTVHPTVPWVMSFVNGTLVLGILFRSTYHLLPGHNAVVKGFVFGIIGWIAMGLLYFPILGRGPFAARLELGVLPAAFSLAMVLAYSVFMGIAFSVLHSEPGRLWSTSG
ncbi:hypothetical protein XH89_12580 [Bradyrhizobium sp. CCBAU 53340]|uniref:DUF6789 family protein n=1 Tax=Bradyrhizobium sp. CCBAU 53340 TaxID=1325112 RepID=UPI00188C1ADA|nr:DUF6789 family protein [Bradyrhizobium sp. CCBAU 53340]QOZ44231.1 hypothetical protein XH89_12580 [Bradyrhizobium sp. CCBAU 53340]